MLAKIVPWASCVFNKSCFGLPVLHKIKMAAEMERTCSAILNAVRVITSSSSGETSTSKQRSFEEVLLDKIKEFKAILVKNSALNFVRSDFENRKRETFEFCQNFFPESLESSTTEEKEEADVQEYNKRSIRWTFVELCLFLLLKLKELLQDISQICKEESEAQNPKQNPKLNPDALGVNDQKTVLTCVQFIVSLGLYPNLLPGVGIPVEKRSGFFELIKGSGEESRNEAHLHKCLSILLDCVKHASLGTIILSRHLGDILTGLIQVCYAPQSCYCHGNNLENEQGSRNNSNGKEASHSLGKIYDENCVEKPLDRNEYQYQNIFISSSQKENCMLQLQRLLGRVYQPMIIKELLMIQGGMRKKSGKMDLRKQVKESEKNASSKTTESSLVTPPWFVEVCGRLLSERVMKPSGVQAVLTAVLESSGASSSSQDWRKCDMVAMVIASCPSQANSLDEYYQHISPQVLKLLHVKHAELNKQFVRVTSSTVKAMLKRNSSFAKKHFMDVLMAPLLCVTKRAENNPGTVICDENSLTQCVEDIYKVFVVGSDPQSPFLLSLCPVIHPIFELFCFTRKGISHLRSFCQEILVRYLKHIDHVLALKTLYVLAYGVHSPEDFGKETNRDDVSSTSNEPPADTSSKTNQTKPVKNNSSHYRGNHITLLMRHEYSYCHGDSGGIVIKLDQDEKESFDDIMQRLTGDDVMMHEVRASCLVELLVSVKNDVLSGEFFLHLMTQLTGIVSNDDESPVTGQAQADLQVFDRQAANNQKSLLTLQLVAVMCDKLGPSILQDCRQMLAFVKSTIQRGCILSDSDLLEGALASETLTMAFGMLSAILGGATKVEARERGMLEELIPLLEQLSLCHNDPKVKEMANDLRIAIATHGAVWSAQMKQAAENLGKMDKAEHSDKTIKTSTDDITFDEALRDLCDPLVPVRGHAIIAIAKLLNKRHPKALSQTDALLKIFMDQLSHDDSYIYLAAVQGLVALSSIETDVVLPHLAREFATCRRGTGKETNDKDSTAYQRSPETKIKLGEALVKAVRDCGELVPRYSQHLFSSLLSGVHDTDEFVRASSLSNIGEVCKLLRFSIGPIINEIFNCLSSVLNTDKSAQVRRAAVLVVTLLLEGLGKDTIQVLSATLRDLYHMIKLVEACDKDEMTRAHARIALGELDTIMREFLFPKQTFTKKIQVLP